DWLRRLQARDRMRRWRRAHPEKVREANARSNPARARSQRDPNIARDRSQERYFRWTERRRQLAEAPQSVVTARDPRILWVDPRGAVHQEDTRSAQEVIEQWQTDQQSR
ncbi:MAG TPA: hypothetical protein VJN42_00335, partial [Candidatus Acidoferrum sp.]|nr:hypothetical protein [Candidatus Acidoferrum sp.]